MIIPDYKVGTTFEEHCTLLGDDKGQPIYNHFGIDPITASLYGNKASDILTVKCTIIEEDVIIKDLMKKDSGYDTNQVDYFGWVDFNDDGTYKISMIYSNIKAYVCCFIYGPDISRFCTRDVETADGYYSAIYRRGMSVRLKVELI